MFKYSGQVYYTSMKSQIPPNQALEPTSLAVTCRADARPAPAKAVAHLERWAKEKNASHR